MNRRDFLKATAATLLSLLPWAKGRREPVAGVDLAAVEDETGIIAWCWDGKGIVGIVPSEEEVQLIMERLAMMRKLAIPAYLIVNDFISPWSIDDPWPHEDKSGVFPGLSRLITSGYQDADM